MRSFAAHGIMSRDRESEMPSWMRRVQVWAEGGKFSVSCGAVSLEEATELIVESLLCVLRKRGREASPIRDADGEVWGIQW